MIIYPVRSMLFIQHETLCRHLGPVPNSHDPSDPPGCAQAGWRASFYRINEDNSGTIPAGRIIVLSPHGVAGDRRGWGQASGFKARRQEPWQVILA
jgi:hypothetical protein